MNALDDVAALAEFAQGRLSALVHRPLARAELSREAKRFELAQATDFQRVEFVRSLSGWRRQIYNALPITISRKLPVETGPAFAVDLAFEGVVDVAIGAIAQFLRDQILRAMTRSSRSSARPLAITWICGCSVFQ